jgi:glyoxylase-like metal-dependent hydrolase (beta-lactamase superfamily II)
VLAPNAGLMTLDGTNTWVLREPATSRSVVVDPGPLDEAHLRTVLDLGAPVAVVLLTHGHADHSAGARRLAELAGCSVRALDPAHRLGGEGLEAGDRITVGGLRVEVVATPGHTGDTVLGRGTTVVAHPDGELGAYLGSLHRLRALAEETGLTRVLPGHGPVLEDAVGVLDGYLRHRAERLSQVRDAVADGARTPADVVARVYADVDPVLWPAAELSVAAQLAYLSERDRAR